MDLTENTLKSGILVIYKNKEYTTGNRYGTMVELWNDDGFYINVDMKDIQTKDPDYLLKILKIRQKERQLELLEINNKINCL